VALRWETRELPAEAFFAFSFSIRICAAEIFLCMAPHGIECPGRGKSWTYAFALRKRDVDYWWETLLRLDSSFRGPHIVSSGMADPLPHSGERLVAPLPSAGTRNSFSSSGSCLAGSWTRNSPPNFRQRTPFTGSLRRGLLACKT